MCENILIRIYYGFNVSSTTFHFLFIPFSPSQHHYLLLVCKMPGKLLWVGSMDSSIWRYHTSHQQIGSTEALKHTHLPLFEAFSHTLRLSLVLDGAASQVVVAALNPSQLCCGLFWFFTSTIRTWSLSWSLVPCFLNMAIQKSSEESSSDL